MSGVNPNNKKVSAKAGCLGCLFIIVVIILIIVAITSCSRNTAEKINEPQPIVKESVIVEPPKTNATNTPAKVEDVMPLDQYNQHLKTLLDEVFEEYLLVKKIKGVSMDVLDEHHVRIEGKLNNVHVSNAKYHIHAALSGRLMVAHGYIISLNQAYRSQNTKQIDDFINLIDENIADFKKLSDKISNKEISNDYHIQ